MMVLCEQVLSAGLFPSTTSLNVDYPFADVAVIFARPVALANHTRIANTWQWVLFSPQMNALFHFIILIFY